MLLIVFLLSFFHSFVFANGSVKFVVGSDMQIRYIDMINTAINIDIGNLETDEDLDIVKEITKFTHPNSYLYYLGTLYMGISISRILGLNQIIFTLTPGVILYYEGGNDGNMSGQKASFFFKEIFFRWDGAMTIIVGKRPLGWGIGFVRQFSFFANVDFLEGDKNYYNIEVQKRKGPFLFSTGFAMDTASIDYFLKKPEWYAPWVNLKIENSKYTLLTSFNVIWGKYKPVNLKTALDFQYFLPKNWEIYFSLSQLSTYLTGLEFLDNIQVLTGLSYEYFHSIVFLMRVFFEYFWDSHNTLSMGFFLSVYQKLTLFTSVEYPPVVKDASRFLVRVSWVPMKHFNMHFTYSVRFLESKPGYKKNQIELGIRLQV